MKFLAKTIVDYVVQEIQREQKILRFILPSYPPALLLAIGEGLQEELLTMPGEIEFEYGVACRLGEEWNQSGNPEHLQAFEKIKDRGWYNADNNLTSLRNKPCPENAAGMVVLLAGYEHIDDKASLQDFFHMDQRTVWEVCMQKSFKNWLNSVFNNYINTEDEEDDIAEIDEYMQDLCNNGFADILAVSNFLEQLDLTGVLTGTEARKAVLNDLSYFKLPLMPGYASKKVKRKFGDYLVLGKDFFDYVKLLDGNERQKLLKRISVFYDENRDKQFDAEELGCFNDLDQLIQNLEKYVQERNMEAKQRLKEVDFVFLNDQILNYKITETIVKPTVKTVTGLAPEVFLRALWITLSDVKKDLTKQRKTAHEYLSKISFISEEFKYDHEKDEDDADSDFEKETRARGYLLKLLGGIDESIKNGLDIKFGPVDEPELQQEIAIESQLSPQEDDQISYPSAKNSMAALKFSVIVYTADQKVYTRTFKWPLPHEHHGRLMIELGELIYDEYKSPQFKDVDTLLPVLKVPYMAELFNVQEETDLVRLMIKAVRHHNCSVENLLQADSISDQSKLRKNIRNLSFEYEGFLKTFMDSGFFSALNNKYDSLRKALVEGVYEPFFKDQNQQYWSSVLFKAFFAVSANYTKGETWRLDNYLPAAIATPLHPAVMEMIRFQNVYLFNSFSFYVRNALEDTSNKEFAIRNWNRVVDLAKIQWPLYGTIQDASGTFDTNVRSFNYLHLIGSSNDKPSFVNNQLLLSYADEDDTEEITEQEMFEETRSSVLIADKLNQYKELYGFAGEGLSLAVYCGGNIQPIIAGVDSYLRDLFQSGQEKLYALSLTIFSDSSDDSAIMRWVNAWKERWQYAEPGTKRSYYLNCLISVKNKVVNQADDLKKDQLKQLIDKNDYDIIIFTDFIKSGTSKFQVIDANNYAKKDYSKFPVLEKICCTTKTAGITKSRERILSNTRFRIGSYHADIMAGIKQNFANPDKRHLVISQSDFNLWKDIIDQAHHKAAWVVCLDASIDDRLLKVNDNSSTKKRDIIGFGTGVGEHGEKNFTVSTEHFTLNDIINKISKQVSNELFAHWSQETCSFVAKCLSLESMNITGLSLVNATGDIKYLREFMANAAVRKMLPRDETAFCDELISLDAYTHWFNTATGEKRPDLLRIKAEIDENGYFNIAAQVIECKLALYNEGFLEDARIQLESGLKQLSEYFKPRIDDEPLGSSPEHKPDQRYWWMQLHRLIASKAETDNSQLRQTLLALERLSEGDYNITWQAGAVAFWRDQNDASIDCDHGWFFSWEDTGFYMLSVKVGGEYIREVCQDAAGKAKDFFVDKSSLTIQCHDSKAKAPATDIGKVNEEQGPGEDHPEDDPENRTGLNDNWGEPLHTDAAGTSIHEPEREGVTKSGNKQIPPRILLGSFTSNPDNKIYWEFGHPELTNRHILVLGSSGTGKTYTIQAIMSELAKSGQNSLVIDYTDGFTSEQLEPVVKKQLNPKQHVVAFKPMAINPFRQQKDTVEGTEIIEKPTKTAQRVAGVFAEVYHIGDQQKSALYNAIRSGIDSEGSNYDLNKLLDDLQEMAEGNGATASSAKTAITKIQPFVHMQPFANEESKTWDELYEDSQSRCHIIQLATFSKDIAQLITEFSLIDLYRYYRAVGSKDNPKVVILDEIQNLTHKQGSPIAQLLTEGRKFGVSLVLATQTLSNLSKEQQDRLFQASHKLIFKPADTEIKSYAGILANATGEKTEDWVKKLSRLQKGECYSLGNVYNKELNQLESNKCIKIRITPLEERLNKE